MRPSKKPLYASAEAAAAFLAAFGLDVSRRFAFLATFFLSK
jgi:hypothetical protein